MKEQLLDRLLRAHEGYFDVQENHSFAGRTFPGYAEFHAHGEGYVLVKRAKLWEADRHQYLFFDTLEHLDASALDAQVGFMRQHGLDKVTLAPNHMSSDICLILIADSIDEDAALRLRRTRFRKNFKLGLQGWSDLKIAAVDLAAQRIVTNAAGRELADTLRANAWPSGRSAGRRRRP